METACRLMSAPTREYTLDANLRNSFFVATGSQHRNDVKKLVVLLLLETSNVDLTVLATDSPASILSLLSSRIRLMAVPAAAAEAVM